MPQEIKRKKKKEKEKKSNVHPKKRKKKKSQRYPRKQLGAFLSILQITLSLSVFSPFWRENSWVPSHFFSSPLPNQTPSKKFSVLIFFFFFFFLIIIFFHPL